MVREHYRATTESSEWVYRVGGQSVFSLVAKFCLYNIFRQPNEKKSLYGCIILSKLSTYRDIKIYNLFNKLSFDN
jgi:hypothetical protein